jgi:hypothetical protein
MTFSYNILFSVALLFALNTCCFSWKRAVLAISGMILIFIAGCRGALVGLLVSVLACFLFGEKSRNQKYAVIAIASVGLIIALFVDWYSMLESIASLLDSFGVSSRTIRMIMEESFLEDSGRGDLRNTVLSELDILGKGLYGDRIALNGTYVHNIFFELMFDYGILFGGILFVAWAGTVVRCVFKVSGVSKVLICALLSGGFVKMFLSGSFLNQEPAVFLLLGICLNCIYANKRALTHAEKPAQVNDR